MTIHAGKSGDCGKRPGFRAQCGWGPSLTSPALWGPLLQPVQGECQCTPPPHLPLPPGAWRALQGSHGLQKQQWPSGCALISFLSYIPSGAYLQLCKFSKFSQPFPRPRHFLQLPSWSPHTPALSQVTRSFCLSERHGDGITRRVAFSVWLQSCTGDPSTLVSIRSRSIFSAR